MMRDLNPGAYRAQRPYDDMSRPSDHNPDHNNYQNQPAKSSGLVLVLLVCNIILILGLGWFIWENAQLSQHITRLKNQVALVHQRLPLLNQMTAQNQFEQRTHERMQQIEKRFAAITDISNQMISSLEQMQQLDLSEEVEQLQFMVNTNTERLERVEQNILLLSNQQERLTRHYMMSVQNQANENEPVE